MQTQLPQTTKNDEALPCLIIPVHSGRLVLPNVTVAEIIPFQSPSASGSSKDWLLGKMEWRGTQVPVVSYELFTGQSASSYRQDARIAVVNSPTGEDGDPLRFFGIVVQGIPSLIKLEQPAIKENLNQKLSRGQAMAVTLETGYAIIPDLDEFEKAISLEPWK